MKTRATLSRRLRQLSFRKTFREIEIEDHWWTNLSICRLITISLKAGFCERDNIVLLLLQCQYG